MLTSITLTHTIFWLLSLLFFQPAIKSQSLQRHWRCNPFVWPLGLNSRDKRPTLPHSRRVWFIIFHQSPRCFPPSTLAWILMSQWNDECCSPIYSSVIRWPLSWFSRYTLHIFIFSATSKSADAVFSSLYWADLNPQGASIDNNNIVALTDIFLQFIL